MITDFDKCDATTAFSADICIVGAGVAGLTLAHEFVGTGLSVLVLESGGAKDETKTQRLYETHLSGLPHEGVHNGRFRVYGGSSTRWGAQLMTLDRIDFERRDYVSQAHWPIAYDDVAAYYDRAQRLLKVNDLSYEADFWDELGVQPIEFNHDLMRYRFAKWAGFRFRNMAKTLGPVCAAANNINILLHANLVEVVPQPDGASIARLRIASLSGKKSEVVAKTYIICCGAIETARLLLASRSMFPAGVGNGNDLVGRYFQDHISVRVARLIPHDRKKFTETFDPFLRGETMHSCKLAMAPEMQRHNGSLNVMGHVVYGFTEESGLYELRKILRAVQSKRNPIPSPMGAWRILRYSSDIFRMVFGQFLARRRLSPKLARCHLDIECEQAPSPDSRVTLSDELDPLGVPLANLDWRLSEHEKKSVRAYVQMFKQEWDRLSLGNAEWNDAVFQEGDAWLQDCRDTYHHAGTTRMSESPRDGVVDTDLKVHGIDNLYIGSTSVFPTSGCANPTLTMMALCVRLADKLKKPG